MVEGTSVGYVDRYPAFFHGQELDVTRLPAGRYVLVHRANPDRTMRELRYSDNAASVLLRTHPAAGSIVGSPSRPAPPVRSDRAVRPLGTPLPVGAPPDAELGFGIGCAPGANEPKMQAYCYSAPTVGNPAGR